jgi:ribosomal RNA-processing protein 12
MMLTNLTYCVTPNLAGYLILGRQCSDDVAKVLQDCIDSHIDHNVFVTNASQLSECDVEDLSDQAAMKSICLTINRRLHTCAYPPDSILTVVLVLFLKLGMSSVFSAVTSLIFSWIIPGIF